MAGISRRQLLQSVPLGLAFAALVACSDDSDRSSASSSEDRNTGSDSSKAEKHRNLWRMPAEDLLHERTWMCWPSSRDVWGSDLTHVQDTIVDIALAIAEFEPVRLLARPEEVAPLRSELGDGIEVIEAPVDDLWARDTLPNFLVRTNAEGTRELGASHARFNGWGDKQIHSGDAALAELVAANLGIALTPSTLVGEGGGIEVDGQGSVLAAASSWVNENRNPGMSRPQVEAAILSMLGADRMLWIDGLAGADITDGHIDTLARFASSEIIVIDKPAFEDPEDPWVQVAERTREQLTEARTLAGKPYELITMTQPENPRGSGDEFLATYMNFYVCNGAVIAPSFGDASADDAARGFLTEHFHDREVVMIDIDPLAAGGGGIHCATQQQPSMNA